MEPSTSVEDKSYRMDQIQSTPLEVANKDLLNHFLSKAITVPQAASVTTEQPPAQTAQAPQQQQQQKQSYLDPSIPEPVMQEEPVIPINFNLLQGFEEFRKRLLAEEKAKQADLSNLPEEQRQYIAKLEEQAQRGMSIEEQAKKNTIQSLQASVNGWIPTALAFEKSQGLPQTEASALEKYLSIIPLHTDPASRAMNNFLMTASKQVQDLKEKHRQDVNTSQKMWKERLALAELISKKDEENNLTKEENKKLKQQIEELSKQVQQISSTFQQQQGLQAQQQNQQQQAPPLFRNPEPDQYIKVSHGASKQNPVYGQLDPLETTFFNANALTGGVDTYGFDNVYNLSKQTAELFKNNMFTDPDNADIKCGEIWPEKAFKRPRM